MSFSFLNFVFLLSIILLGVLHTKVQYECSIFEIMFYPLTSNFWSVHIVFIFGYNTDGFKWQNTRSLESLFYHSFPLRLLCFPLSVLDCIVSKHLNNIKCYEDIIKETWSYHCMFIISYSMEILNNMTIRNYFFRNFNETSQRKQSKHYSCSMFLILQHFSAYNESIT